MRSVLESVAAVAPLLGAAALFVVFHRNAHAYLDPGTGSVVLQVVIAAIFGGLFTIKLFLRRVKNRLTRRSSEETDAGAPSGDGRE
jgi:hypothetical protein